jgi:hypothetical protein
VKALAGVLVAGLAMLAGTEAPNTPLLTPRPPALNTPAIGGAIPPPSTCEAPSLAYLVGHMKSEIPVPVYPAKRRVICDSCEMTQDFRPDRTNILFDANTGVITAVTCG